MPEHAAPRPNTSLTIVSSDARVQFDRRELGVELVKDVDVMPIDPTENLPSIFAPMMVISSSVTPKSIAIIPCYSGGYTLTRTTGSELWPCDMSQLVVHALIMAKSAGTKPGFQALMMRALRLPEFSTLVFACAGIHHSERPEAVAGGPTGAQGAEGL